MSDEYEPAGAEPSGAPPGDPGEPGEPGEEPSLIDRLRGTGVGVEDPNIVGDVGPTDIPPGRDPDNDGLFADPPPPPT